MSTTFLRFPDAATFVALLPTGAAATGETFGQMPAGIAAISVIGWHDVTVGNVGSVAGYLVNAQCAQLDPLGAPIVPVQFAPYVCTPTPVTPIRVMG